MKTLTIFYLENCPYCRNAKKALEELTRQVPSYGQIPIDWIEENRQPELANARDYYYVPTIYLREKKLYEAHPGESYEDCLRQVRAALDAAQ